MGGLEPSSLIEVYAYGSVDKNYADLSLVISALNRLDRRSIPRIVVTKI